MPDLAMCSAFRQQKILTTHKLDLSEREGCRRDVENVAQVDKAIPVRDTRL